MTRYIWIYKDSDKKKQHGKLVKGIKSRPHHGRGRKRIRRKHRRSEANKNKEV